MINVSCEVGAQYNEERAREKTLRIYETMEKVLDIARRDGVSTSQAADRLAEGAHPRHEQAPPDT